jgi:hypothetical protein
MTAQAQENTSTLLPVAYMAPESIRKQEYSIKSDSFSFGVFLWEIVTRYETAQQQQQQQQRVGQLTRCVSKFISNHRPFLLGACGAGRSRMRGNRCWRWPLASRSRGCGSRSPINAPTCFVC